MFNISTLGDTKKDITVSKILCNFTSSVCLYNSRCHGKTSIFTSGNLLGITCSEFTSYTKLAHNSVYDTDNWLGAMH
jgi:hypothetical protein